MTSSGLTSLLWFIAILALIPAALWLLKRTPVGGAGSANLMKSVAALPLSASQRIVTIEVGQGDSRRWLVLGVTPSSITTLHTMEPVEGAAPAAPTGPAFAGLLAKLQRPAGDADAR
ncbi:flagellar biosynthetic protein FliO [Rhizobacter sp. AJA081-3]|uniref:FliO/MopB family protein n=1 Tax=Rhizobacter sp. AJA081-3 TaxID=2753607 RepID=UPI001ADFEFD8|nr:flagellar biosynthetic protein FliO [Rhizobacter sp. AJA081-3]QTN24047.1 flagellar biosynthetic protein FliO [Rhizobacter sp. AJA081-3]